MSPTRAFARGSAVAAALVAIALPLAKARAAGAESSERLDLEWSAPVECPSAGDVIKQVDRLLGERSGATSAPKVRVSGVVSQDDAGFRVRIEAPGEGAARARELR